MSTLYAIYLAIMGLVAVDDLFVKPHEEISEKSETNN